MKLDVDLTDIDVDVSQRKIFQEILRPPSSDIKKSYITKIE